MIKPKAPKDMTATEFVEHLELVASREMLAKNTEGWAITLQGIRRELSEPAPNPFTPDQLAWMREEQRNGFNYAGMNCAGITFGEAVELYEKKPMKDCTHWNKISGSNSKSSGNGSWLERFLSIDDPEPLCFADYAPLGGKVNE